MMSKPPGAFRSRAHSSGVDSRICFHIRPGRKDSFGLHQVNFMEQVIQDMKAHKTVPFVNIGKGQGKRNSTCSAGLITVFNSLPI